MEFHLEGFLAYRLNRLNETVSSQFRPIYKDRFGLTRPEWRVLAALADFGPTTATEVGARSAQHKTRVSRAVRSLEERRWLKRERMPEDRRAENLRLTPAGLAAYRDLAAPIRTREEQLLAGLSAKDRAALERGLAALEASLGIVAAPKD